MKREANNPLNDPQSWKKLWIAISGVIVAVVSVFDLITNSFGFIETVIEWSYSPPQAIVHVSSINIESGGTCLEFGFEKLPSDFNLGKIHFKIIDTYGPTPITGDMAAHVLRLPRVYVELSPAILSGNKKELVFSAPFQANKRNDTALVDFCPILTMSGWSGKLVVIPSFFSVANELIEDIKMTTNEGVSIEEGITIILSRPKNAEISVDNTRLQVLTR